MAGDYLVVHRWLPHFSFDKIPSHWVSYWVQMHGFHMEDFSIENARVFGQPFGEVLVVEDLFDGSKGIRDCLRVRLKLDARNLLPNGFWLER